MYLLKTQDNLPRILGDQTTTTTFWCVTPYIRCGSPVLWCMLTCVYMTSQMKSNLASKECQLGVKLAHGESAEDNICRNYRSRIRNVCANVVLLSRSFNNFGKLLAGFCEVQEVHTRTPSALHGNFLAIWEKTQKQAGQVFIILSTK
jgi:hypothetical protein